ncbi:GAF domain-containing protein [Candidatus Nitrotoga sp. M5]|uniref:GAF domain-containing protein n=1 Tax=Candidatus Nitrotoga sp. M5 TaxID=2890409 RepID=UPI001EF249E9|nr:GAF domain-containing protein [Candidatus Nitrotoga sp. M5]CAH1385958.1 GAF domain-containing protein [Candidatus Nitrotoga sp. M5]
MADVETPLIKLQDLSNFLENGNLNDSYAQLAEMTAKILSATNCSIMLLNDGEPDNLLMSVCASYGPMPTEAYKESIGKGEGIAGHVIATGQALLIDDISQSKFAKLARRANEPGKSLILSPITISGHIVGVVNVSGHLCEIAFSLVDLNLLKVVALFIGKSIQTIQLQSILNSRFAQLALAREAQNNIGASLGNVFHNPDQVAKIFAKSFYKEMARGGFSSNQIIGAASEIISQLSDNLQQHSKRMERKLEK